MNENKHDFKKGLIYFLLLSVCLCSFITTPDRDTLLYKFMGLFGISPDISFANGGILYIYMLIPLIIGIICIKKVLQYWWEYGTRFKEYNLGLKYLPAVIIIVLLLLSINIDALYYNVIKYREGLQSIVYYDTSNTIEYEFKNGIKTYSYDFYLQNFSEEALYFEIMFIDDFSVSESGEAEIYIKDENGVNKTFVIYPNQKTNFAGKFSIDVKLKYSGSGNFTLNSIYLINGDEKYSPKQIKQRVNY